jgi:hypothetical protein
MIGKEANERGKGNERMSFTNTDQSDDGRSSVVLGRSWREGDGVEQER